MTFKHYFTSTPLPIAPFWEPDYTEPTVQLALREYCKPGDVVFDAGANSGALSKIMSRLVGPRGVVCAFEASPRIIGITNLNLVQSGCHNVQLFHKAVYHTSHQTVDIFLGTHLNDSIYNTFADPALLRDKQIYKAKTVALDDFVTETGLIPKLIKFDIEGAEFDALKGAVNLLKKQRPILILEQGPTETSCYEFLSDLGYLAVDLCNNSQLHTREDFVSAEPIMNVLYVHKDQAENDPYLNISSPELIAEWSARDIEINDDGDMQLRSPFELAPGRYLCVANFTATGTTNNYYAGIRGEEGVYCRYNAYSSFLAAAYRHWMFQVHTHDRITPYLECLSGRDESLKVEGFTLFRFKGFETRKPSLLE